VKQRIIRTWAAAFLGSLLLHLLVFGQQTAAKPKKDLTPEQKEYWAKRQSLQAQGKQIFNAEMDSEKAGDCPDAQTTYDFNTCFVKEAAISEQNLKNFEEVIRELQAPSPRMPGDTTNDTDSPGIAGVALTPQHLSAEFEGVEQSWQTYRERACTAAFRQFSGGTGGASFELQCELKLILDHIRELKMIYGEDFL